MLPSLMEGSEELHEKSIRVLFNGVAALCIINEGTSKLVMLEVWTVWDIVTLVQAGPLSYLCQMRSYGSYGYLQRK